MPAYLLMVRRDQERATLWWDHNLNKANIFIIAIQLNALSLGIIPRLCSKLFQMIPSDREDQKVKSYVKTERTSPSPCRPMWRSVTWRYTTRRSSTCWTGQTVGRRMVWKWGNHQMISQHNSSLHPRQRAQGPRALRGGSVPTGGAGRSEDWGPHGGRQQVQDSGGHQHEHWVQQVTRRVHHHDHLRHHVSNYEPNSQ